MLEQLKAIDTTAVKKLVKVKKDEEQLERYRKEAEKRRADVDGAVFKRVADDYNDRASALQKEAVPLRNEARGEYQKLRAICDELTAACEKARVDKEELDFRHAVGELSKTALGKQLKRPQEMLEKCEGDLEEAARVREQFVVAFHSEEDLEAGVEGFEPGSTAPAATVLTPAPEAGEAPASGGATVLMTPAMIAAAAEEEEGAKPDTGATVVLPGGGQAEETFVLSQTARLVLSDDDEESTEYRLGFQNGVGRDEENDIHISSGKVSRKHALVSATPTGYMIKDLKSQSGTFVNRERVTECQLSDGDRVQVGDVELVFHSA
jgi:hypothetical protein